MHIYTYVYACIYIYVYTSRACCWCGRVYLQMKIHQHDGYVLLMISIMNDYALHTGHGVFFSFYKTYMPVLFADT